MKKIDKRFLGGIFRWPELKYKIGGKFGFLPRDETNEILDEINGYIGRYPSDMLTNPPSILPRIYPHDRGF